MRKLFLLSAFLLIHLNAVAQDGLESMKSAVEINATVLRYPKHFSNPENLAKLIRNDFKTEREKAQALYSWMAFNIRYDVKKFRNRPKPKTIKFKTQEEKLIKERKLLDKQIRKTLSSRKGICGDYSVVFHSVATLVGLNCEINQGAAKTEKYDIGKRRAVIDHAWNSVQIDGEWKLVDATWGAGYLDEETDKFVPEYNLFYFDTPKELFFANHYPEKGVWHDSTVDKKEFLDALMLYASMLDGSKIIEPKSGVIVIKKGEKLKFRIADLDPDSHIKYSLKQEGETSEISSKTTTDNVTEFEITIDKTIGRYLTLYVDGRGIAIFRINQTK